MNQAIDTKMVFAFMVALSASLAIALCWACNSRADQKVSDFGKYQGYSEAIYDGTRRSSDYLTLSNGTRLAYDLILPTKKGVPAGEPLPVLFKYTPYLRTFTLFDKDGKNIGSSPKVVGKN